MKLVYVVCAEHVDYLYLLAANVTLSRRAAPGCRTVCVLDRRTAACATAARFRFDHWVDEVVTVDTPEPNPELSSRFLKTTLREHVRGDYLYLDLDAVLVNGELLRHLDTECLAAGPNLDHLRLDPDFPEEIGRTIYEPMGWEHPFLPYVNAGVLFCRDNSQSRRIYARWHELWKQQRERVEKFVDQPALNRALWENPGCLKLMPSIFNSPVDVGLEFETGAWVYHYYISIYSGKPRRDSLLGIVAREIQRRGGMNRALLRFLLGRQRAFIPEAYDARGALKERLWVHAWNLWRDGSVETGPTQAMRPFKFRAVRRPTGQKA